MALDTGAWVGWLHRTKTWGFDYAYGNFAYKARMGQGRERRLCAGLASIYIPGAGERGQMRCLDPHIACLDRSS